MPGSHSPGSHSPGSHAPNGRATAPLRTAPIWDPPIRAFHWLLVVLLAFSWWSGEQHDMERHRLSGYAILALLVFRLIWGVIGPRTARFSSFVRGPRAVIAYVKDLGSRTGHAADGHNPLGGWSVVAMLLALAVLVSAGLFASDVDGLESGPLAIFVTFEQSETATEIHEMAFNIVLALVAVHVLAILFYLVWKRQNLIRPMLTGRRMVEEAEAVADDAREGEGRGGHGIAGSGAAEPASFRWYPLRALVAVVLAVLVAWAVASAFQFSAAPP